MAPWIRDSEGNDALDLSGIPTPSDPLFDDASAEQTFGSNPVTETVDQYDDLALGIGGSVAGLPLTGSLGYDGSGDGEFTQTAQDGREWAESNPEKIKWAIYAAVAVGVMVVARPLFEIAANLSE